MIEPTPTALVATGLSSIREPIRIFIDPEVEPTECHALLSLSVASLPSRRLVPVPRELAGELVPVAKAFGAPTCDIAVWQVDDSLSEEERFSEELCRRGTFRYDGASWSAEDDEESCW